MVLNDQEVFQELRKRLKDDFWAQFAIDKMRSALWNGKGYCNVGNLRVSKQWPLKGCISFTREPDGKRMRFYVLRGYGWYIKDVKGS